jgi:hypothetical protein
MIRRAALLAFLRSHRYAVQSSVHESGAAQSAIVGVAVSDDFEIVFDTIRTSRKARNLRQRPHVAFVIGDLDGKDERTVQYEGAADEPDGSDRDRLVALYLSVFPDGRERQQWPGLTYVRARPRWLRFSDYNQDPPEIVEWDQESLRTLR